MRFALACSLLLLAPLAARADGSFIQAVDKVITQHERDVRACARHLERRGDVVAINVLLTIDPSGRVIDAFAPTGSRAATCLEKLARGLTFPAPDLETQVAYPFLLSSKR